MPEPAPARPTVVILTALDVETSAVLRHISGVQSEMVSGTGFFRGQFEGWDIAVAEVGAGNAGAAAIAVRACEHYQPNTALFVGVAGGVKDVSVGDVVVATKVYGYESGKDEATEFKPRPTVQVSAHALEQRARIIRQVEDWRARLDPGLGHGHPKLYVGPIAAGEKVVASKRAHTAKLICENYGDALAVEMEGRGFLEGVHLSHPVSGCVIRGISDLLSGKAAADESGSQERAADAAAAVAFQILAGLGVGTPGSRKDAPNFNDAKTAPLSASDLKAMAAALLEAGTPPSIAMLFPTAPNSALLALEASSACERTLIEPNASANGPNRFPIGALVNLEQRKHLVLGLPGSGKTRGLWNAANQLLHHGDLIPLFLPAGQIKRWDSLVSMIHDAAPALSPNDVLRDPRICVFVDGWSEFASGEHVVEKQKALRALRDARVIANGKSADSIGTPFKSWSLEPLSSQQVKDVLYAARPGEPVLSDPLLDLLRLPLLLAIHVLSGQTPSETGELLRQLHDHLARDLPEAFTEALAETVAELSLSGERSFGRLISILQDRCSAKGVQEPAQLLRRLGTIVERNGQALPIHDLYWSWLSGRGLIARRSIEAAIPKLETRESYRLALQSGGRPAQADVSLAANDDLVLASTLDSGLRLPAPNADVASGIDVALGDGRLAVRNRGGLAGLASCRSAYLKSALETLSEIHRANIYVADWPQHLHPQILFPQRAIVADWIGLEGSAMLLDAIADRGDAEWVPWLEQVAFAGKITKTVALASALGCAADIPAWGRPHLDDLFKEIPWKLRAAASRRSNLALGRYIAAEYERIVTSVIAVNSSAWIDLNRALVGCADDAAFESLLSRFDAMPKRAQELLGYAVVERGQPWIAAFQRIAFAKPPEQAHHRLAEVLSPEIDDATAHAWIAAGNYEEGWRVLIAHHGATVLPELIAELPPSFADIHHIPALSVMRFLDQAPPTLHDELWRRLGSPMQPKAMQDVLNATAKIYPTGVPSIVQYVSQQPAALPAYHLAQSLRLYEAWRERIGAQLMVNLASGESIPFPEWIATYSGLYRWEDHFTPQMLASLPDLAINMVLNHFKADIKKSGAVLSSLKDLKSFHADLFDYMLSVPQFTKLVPTVFADAFQSFPSAALHRCVLSLDIDQEVLLFRLGSTSNPLHRSVHEELIRRVLEGPLNLHHIRYVANMLRGHTVEDTDSLLRDVQDTANENWLWLAREVETARGQRLIDERGSLLRKHA